MEVIVTHTRAAFVSEDFSEDQNKEPRLGRGSFAWSFGENRLSPNHADLMPIGDQGEQISADLH